MDEYKELELQALDNYSLKLNKNHFVKRTLQLVVSVSIFSLILCCCYSGFPQSSNVHFFSTFLFSFCTHTLERKYMFLICNGILAFLAKTSSASTSASAYVAGGGDHHDDDSQRLSASDLLGELKASVDVYRELPPAANGALVAEQQRELFVQEVIQEKQKHQVQLIEASQVSLLEDEEPVIAEEEEEEAVNEPCTDELNKKIEEFIRKVKEELRIEAQQQLIAV